MLRFALALLPLLAVAFGGSVDRPGQGGLLLALGMVLLWRPPAAGVLGRPLAAVAGALIVWATLPLLLPAALFPNAAWRTALTDDLGIPLAPPLSPQPWLTADALVLLLAGLAWLWWATDAAGALTDRERRAAARGFVLGAAALALTAIVCQRLHVQPPGWRQERGFGPFPNRNQFGNFLALAGLLALGGAHADWRGRRWARAVLMTAALAVLSVAVFVNYSRAGVLMLLGGAGIYAGASAFGGGPPPSGRDHRDARVARLGVAAAVLTLLLATFFLVGGETLGRFTQTDPRGTAGMVTGDFRWKVQADALGMVRAMPFCGPGLGNFAALFPAFRERTTTTAARAVHPESDWLWLGTEMGWPAMLLAALGAGLLAWRLRAGGERSPMRTAARIGLGAFALHGFMEVSTHRMGTMFVAALLYALALPGADPTRKITGCRWPFRLLGAGLATVGALWLHAAWTGAGWPPGKLAAENLRRAGNTALRARDRPGAVALLTRAAAMLPLEWGIRNDLAFAQVNAGQPEDARANFRRARELEPLNPDLPANEAALWLAEGRHPEAALTAIEETFRRDPVLGERTFTTALAQHGADPDLLPGLESLARREPALEVIFLENVSPTEVWPWLDEVIAADPDLTRYVHNPDWLRRFLRQWVRHGDPAEMLAAMGRHPAWQAVAWREWAEAVVNGGDALGGCRLLERFARKPELPAVLEAPVGEDVNALAEEFSRSPENFALGLRLFRAQSVANRPEEALRTLGALGRLPGAPGYLDYLSARLRTAVGDGPGAWEAWGRYLQNSEQG